MVINVWISLECINLQGKLDQSRKWLTRLGLSFFAEIQSVCQEFTISFSLRGWHWSRTGAGHSFLDADDEVVPQGKRNPRSDENKMFPVGNKGNDAGSVEWQSPGKSGAIISSAPFISYSGFILTSFILIVEVAERLSLFHFTPVQTLVTSCFRVTSIFNFLTTNLLEKEVFKHQWELQLQMSSCAVLKTWEFIAQPLISTGIWELTLSTRLSRSQVIFTW